MTRNEIYNFSIIINDLEKHGIELPKNNTTINYNIFKYSKLVQNYMKDIQEFLSENDYFMDEKDIEEIKELEEVLSCDKAEGVSVIKEETRLQELKTISESKQKRINDFFNEEDDDNIVFNKIELPYEHLPSDLNFETIQFLYTYLLKD